MQRSPDPAVAGRDQGLASAPAPSPKLPGRAHRRARTVLLLLALAAALPGPAAAQDEALYPASPPPVGSTVSLLRQPTPPEPLQAEPPWGGAGPWALGIIVGIAALAAGIAAIRHFRGEREPGPEEGPFVVFAPPPAGATPLPARAEPRSAPVRPAPAPPPPAAVPAGVAEPVRKVAAPPPPVSAADPDELTVRIQVPAEGRLQFLPGALEVLQGHDLRREIRFPRPAEGAPDFTIGRTGGAPDRHVQLPAPTVSRLHARMAFAEGGWSISNLSVTNPLRVNGRELSAAGEAVPLADGDRIEIGEVILRYRGPS